jgi:hypothetical protein
MDSRPSDAIALALRMGAPIFVEEEVIREAGLEVDGPEGLEGLDLEAMAAPELEVLASDPAPSPEVQVPGRPIDWIGQRVVTLKVRLREAVAQEDYEEAARLRDEIGRLEHEKR